MSLAAYSIGELWQTFLPRRREIVGSSSTDLISLVVYKPDHFADFKPTNEFETWLPAYGFVLANRPHFEVLGAKYKNNDPASEEEIWIPIQTQ